MLAPSVPDSDGLTDALATSKYPSGIVNSRHLVLALNNSGKMLQRGTLSRLGTSVSSDKNNDDCDSLLLSSAYNTKSVQQYQHHAASVCSTARYVAVGTHTLTQRPELVRVANAVTIRSFF